MTFFSETYISNLRAILCMNNLDSNEVDEEIKKSWSVEKGKKIG